MDKLTIPPQTKRESPLNTTELTNSFLKRVEETSGKPVVFEGHPNWPRNATIQIAKQHERVHVLTYKAEHAAALPYLTAFQCLVALRTIEAAPESRFRLEYKPIFISDVLKLVTDHTQSNGSVPGQSLEKPAKKFGYGLGSHLLAMSHAIWIDQEIVEGYPDLRPFQRQNVEQQLQEYMHFLSPQFKEIAPPQIIAANASMSAAYAIFWSRLWSEPDIALPYVTAGYQQVGDELLAITKRIPNDPNHDRQRVDAWIERLGLQGWCHTVAR